MQTHQVAGNNRQCHREHCWPFSHFPSPWTNCAGGRWQLPQDPFSQLLTRQSQGPPADPTLEKTLAFERMTRNKCPWYSNYYHFQSLPNQLG